MWIVVNCIDLTTFGDYGDQNAGRLGFNDACDIFLEKPLTTDALLIENLVLSAMIGAAIIAVAIGITKKMMNEGNQ